MSKKDRTAKPKSISLAELLLMEKNREAKDPTDEAKQAAAVETITAVALSQQK